MQIVTLQDARLLAWAERILDQTYDPTTCRWVAGLADGGVVWVAVYSHFSTRNCLVSIATDGSKRWASRTTFRTICGFAFKQWGLARMTFLVAVDNERSLAMFRHSGRASFGAVEEGRMRVAFNGDVDGIVFGLLAKECKWL